MEILTNLNSKRVKNCCCLYQIFCFFLLFANCTNLNSQNQLFKNFNAIDGLSSSEVYDITQDNMGYLWFATDRGLTRYDGKIFKRYSISEGLLDNTILNFYEQKDGTIWCSTLNHKIFYFKNEKEGFKAYSYNLVIEESIPNNFVINNLVVSEDKSLFLTFNNKDLFLEIDTNGKVLSKPIKGNKTNQQKLILKALKKVPNFIFRDNLNLHNSDIDFSINTTYLLGASSFIRVLNDTKNKRRCVFYKNRYFFISPDGTHITNKVPNNSSLAIMADKLDEDYFWIGYQYGGAIILDTQGNIKYHFLKDESVTKVFKDHEGGLWISTLNSGVFYNKEPLINHYAFDSFPTELDKDNDNGLFIAFHNGIVRKKTEKSEEFSKLYSSNKKHSVFIGFDKTENYLYIEELYSKKELVKDNKAYIDQVFGISDDEFFTNGFSKSHISFLEDTIRKVVKVPERIYDISKINDAILIGTQGGLYEYKNDSLKSLKDNSSFFNNRISDIDTDDNQAIITTMGNGLIVRKKDTIFSINSRNGLLSDICTEVYIEDPYTLWVGTNRGVNRVTLYKNNTFDIDTLSHKEGLICSEILDIEIVNGFVWLASREGLFRFSKSIFEKVNSSYKKWLHLDKVIVNNKPFAKNDEIVLQSPESSLKVYYNTVSFKNGGYNEYRYKIKDKEEWNYTTNTAIDLSHLTYGSYQFRLQVKNENQEWIETIDKNILVVLPFWKSSWFISLILILIGLFIFLFFRFRVLVFNKKHFIIIYHGILNKLRRNQEELSVSIKSNGNTIRLITSEIGYFKSSRNYVEIFTEGKKYLIRKKIDEFFQELPDTIEFLKVHRSYYIRIDKVKEIKGNKEVVIFDVQIPISKTYLENIKRTLKHNFGI